MRRDRTQVNQRSGTATAKITMRKSTPAETCEWGTGAMAE